MSLFARLGLLHTVEVSESNWKGTSFASHSAGALGITGASTSSNDYLDHCLQHCPQEIMFKLIGFHLNNRQFFILKHLIYTDQYSLKAIFFPLLHAPSFLSVSS